MKIDELLALKRENATKAKSILESENGSIDEAQKLLNDNSELDKKIEALKSASEQLLPVNEPEIKDVKMEEISVAEPWKSGSSVKNFFTGNREEANYKAYAFGTWLKAIGGNVKAQQWCKNNLKAQIEGTNNLGGFAVPDILSSDIIWLREQFGVARRNCKVVPMTSDTLLVPVADLSTSVYYPGENTAITASDITFAQKTLSAKKMAALTLVSKELSEDAVVDMGALLARDFAYIMAREEDRVIFNNAVDATSTIDGILYAVYNQSGTKANIASVKNFAAGAVANGPTLDDIRGLVSKLPRFAESNAKWYCHKTWFYDFVGKRLDAVGGNNMYDVMNAYGDNPTLYGYPVEFVQTMPKTNTANTAVCLLGDLQAGTLFGDRRGFSVEVSDHVKFIEDSLTYKATCRYAFNAHSLGNVNANVPDQTPGALIVGATVAT